MITGYGQNVVGGRRVPSEELYIEFHWRFILWN